MIKTQKLELRERKKKRIRKKILGTPDRPRVCIYRSNKHFYVQVIDDVNQKTLFAASTLSLPSRGLDSKGKKTKESQEAIQLGGIVGSKFKGKKLVLDRNGFLYHGRIKAFTEALRNQGGVL